LKNFWDLNNVLTTAKSEGFAEGEAAGLERGRAEGEAAGLERGRAEEKLATARNLKRLGIDSDKISQATGLSIDEISRL
jgi:predicted transposase/invertase (TIGR01784 family)